MASYYEKPVADNIVGSFTDTKNIEFFDGVSATKSLMESAYNLSITKDIEKIAQGSNSWADYKDSLLQDVTESVDQDNIIQAMAPAKLDQLFENSKSEIVNEAYSTGPLQPIVGLTHPVLKKNYLELHAKDIVLTEIPNQPIIKHKFERKFVKDADGKKYYVPEIFYGDGYKEVISKTIGAEVVKDFKELPLSGFNVLEASGGSLRNRDALSADFAIEAIKVTFQVGGAAEEVLVDQLNIQGEKSNNGGFSYTVKTKSSDDQEIVAMISGAVDFQNGKISVSATDERVTAIRFSGHLSNENNLNTVEMDREAELLTWEIPDGARINTGMTLERIRDMQALFNIDIINDTIGDMSEFLTQMEDSRIFSFLDDSYNRWKDRYDLPFGYDNGFTETFEFSGTPETTAAVTAPQYTDQVLKYRLNRMIDQLKLKLRTRDVMFVVYGNPVHISLLQDDIQWVINEDTKIGGVTLDYSFGILFKNQNRVHVVSSMKTDPSKGLRVAAYPASSNQYTFKHYKYSLNIDNTYRNPFTPLTNNVMATSRYLTKEVTPVQGNMVMKDVEYGRKTREKPSL